MPLSLSPDARCDVLVPYDLEVSDIPSMIAAMRHYTQALVHGPKDILAPTRLEFLLLSVLQYSRQHGVIDEFALENDCVDSIWIDVYKDGHHQRLNVSIV